MENKVIYRSKIDWWLWFIIIMSYSMLIPIGVGTYWWLTLIYGLLFTAIYVVCILGCRYEIYDQYLIVYQFFKPHRFPIAKIKSVTYTVGYLATAGMSSRRVSIKFTDRSVMKSSMPIEISPKDRDGFCAQLKNINPEIEIIK